MILNMLMFAGQLVPFITTSPLSPFPSSLFLFEIFNQHVFKNVI